MINGVMMQGFHWYSESDGLYWERLGSMAQALSRAGFSAVWLPPAYKGIGGIHEVGYGVYDMYDLGEFPQKGSVRTKYGTKDQYLQSLKALQDCGLQVYVDVVLNHRMGGDNAESVLATPYSQRDRLRPLGASRMIRTFTHFNFPGRAKQYSDFEWHWRHFDAVDFDENTSSDNSTIYLLDGKAFDDQVALENGNFSYLMGCDLDFQNAEVREEVTRWAKWYLSTTKADGFRLDAIKHIAAWFFPEWLDELERYAGKDLFVVGEYWVSDVQALLWYVDRVGGRMCVFDVPLHFNFYEASRSSGNYDMRRILNGSLVQLRPTHAVTFVDNHDSQPLQALESPVDTWFKPLAYAIILLRSAGYPCVFYPDYFGATYEDKGRDGKVYKVDIASLQSTLDLLLHARREYAYGDQLDYFDHFNTIGWTRLGDSNHPKTMAVLMSDGPAGCKWMRVGKPEQRYVDMLGNVRAIVRTNTDGWGEFYCAGGSVSVWVEADGNVS